MNEAVVVTLKNSKEERDTFAALLKFSEENNNLLDEMFHDLAQSASDLCGGVQLPAWEKVNVPDVRPDMLARLFVSARRLRRKITDARNIVAQLKATVDEME